MRLSTSTNIYFNRPDGSHAPIEDSIRLCADAGYRVMDMNFHDCATFRLPFVESGWEGWIKQLGAYAKARNVIFSQAHAHFYNFCEPQENAAQLDELVYRSILGAAMLDIPWVVIHAGTAFSAVEQSRVSKEKNLHYLGRLAQFAKEQGVGIAVENLWDLNIAPRTRYTHNAEELCDLIDALQMSNVGACWDFEHADISNQDQGASLRLLGHRLKATHVSEQAGVHFDHLLPCSTHMDWGKIMPVLTEIGYGGDFTYEIHRYTSTIPQPLIPHALEYSVQVGKYLLSLA